MAWRARTGCAAPAGTAAPIKKVVASKAGRTGRITRFYRSGNLWTELFHAFVVRLCKEISVKFRLCVLMPAIGLVWALAGGAAAIAADVSGDWEANARYLGDVTYFPLKLQVSGDKLTGSLNELKLEGSIHGDDLAFKATRPNGDHFGDFKGSVHGN